MKNFRLLLAALAAMAALGLTADDKKAKDAKPYQLTKCLVSDEKFEGSDMEPYEFVHEGQTVKLCCKSCLKDFNKDKTAFMKKLDEETKKLADAKK
jgi:hypothetical protein